MVHWLFFEEEAFAVCGLFHFINVWGFIVLAWANFSIGKQVCAEMVFASDCKHEDVPCFCFGVAAA